MFASKLVPRLLRYPSGERRRGKEETLLQLSPDFNLSKSQRGLTSQDARDRQVGNPCLSRPPSLRGHSLKVGDSVLIGRDNRAAPVWSLLRRYGETESHPVYWRRCLPCEFACFLDLALPEFLQVSLLGDAVGDRIPTIHAPAAFILFGRVVVSFLAAGDAMFEVQKSGSFLDLIR